MSTSIQAGGFSTPLNLDAFGRLRVADPDVLVSTTNIHDDTPHLWQNVTEVGGTTAHNAAKARTELNVTAAHNDRVVRQTRFYVPYQPGRSLLLLSTFCLNTVSTNSIQRAGYFDDNDGFYLERRLVQGLGFVHRTSTSGSPVDTQILQTNWNGDKLDGSGPSGITLDPSKTQIMWLDLEWLGVGSVRIGFVIDGVFICCHQFNHANSLGEVYMASGNLPWRFELHNVSGATNGAMRLDQICFSAILEGGAGETFSRPRSTDSGNTKINAANGVEVPLVAYRLKAGFNKALIVPKNFGAVAEDNTKATYVRLYAAPTGSVSAGTWNSVSDAVEAQIAPTVPSLASARLLASGLISEKVRGGESDLNGFGSVGRDLAGTVDEVILTVTPLSANSDFWAAVNWKEVY